MRHESFSVASKAQTLFFENTHPFLDGRAGIFDPFFLFAHHQPSDEGTISIVRARVCLFNLFSHTNYETGPQPPKGLTKLKRQKERVFIDFEASSLSSKSWPIEIGLAWFEGSKVRSDSRLIRPRAFWEPADWDPESEAVHGIALSELHANGFDADAVAEWFGAHVGDAELLSDAPEFDQYWLDTLLGSAGPQIKDFEWTAWDAFGDNGTIHVGRFSRVAKTKASRVLTHRAASDAEDLACFWLSALQ